MTNTKKIVWRLKEQPTSKMLQELVSSGILTKEEAREILFNLEDWELKTPNSEKEIENLKSEIKFLRELVEKLANTQKVVEIIREIEKPYRSYYWWKPYWIWTNIMNNLTWATTTTNSQDFSSIKTF